MVTLSPPHLLGHPAFAGIEPRAVMVPPGFMVNGVGQKLNVVHDASIRAAAEPLYNKDFLPTLPWGWLHEEIYEWIAVAESVRDAKSTFTMIELGAGFGRWLVAAEMIARRVRSDLTTKLIGVEAESTHYRWMHEHFQDNDLDPSRHTLIEAAIAPEAGELTFFEADDPSADYGQFATSEETGTDPSRKSRKVKAISLEGLLADCPRVDLIDADIQGYERFIIPAAIEAMSKKVKRAYISIHEPLEIFDEVSDAFSAAGWRLLKSAPVKSTLETEYGTIFFGDGHQYWINPNI